MLDPVSNRTALTTNVVKGGQGNVARVGAGGKKELRKQEKTVSTPSSKPASSTVDAFGVETTTKADGTVSKKAQSGVGIEESKDGSRTLSFSETGDTFKLEGESLSVTSGEAKNATITKNQEGIELVSFTDKSGHQVQIDPDSLTYEVINKRGDTAQVFHPDGQQELVAFGTLRGPDGKHQPYEKRALYDQQGQLVENAGFNELEAKDGKISFQLGEGRATRSLARPLPGQPPFEEVKSESVTQAPQNPTAPTALLAEDFSAPLVGEKASEPSQSQPSISGKMAQAFLPQGKELELESPTKPPNGSDAAPKAESSVSSADEVTTSQKSSDLNSTPSANGNDVFPDLPKFSEGFFDRSQQSDTVHIAETRSGVKVREEGTTRAYSLPTGDMFRTDGTDVEVLGDQPRARNARIVVEDGKQLLAYSDKARNTFQLDVNTGDLAITNANGSLKQRFNADGSQEFEARSTHTTEAGSKEHSFHKAKFGADGTLVEKSGFEQLEVAEKSLVHTLPNGEVSVRNLMEQTSVRHSEPKPVSPGIAEGWGDVGADVDQILGKTAKVGPTPVSPENRQAGDVGNVEGPNSFAKPQFARSGMSRTTLPDGSVMTRLPNGIAFTDDGEKPFATDPDGNRLEVLKREVPTESGYILYTKSNEGIGYTIAPNHLDMIVESKDGKVHQMVTESGFVDTVIRDGKNIHTHQLDMNRMQQTATPGVRSDVRTPDRLYIDSPDNRSYELPHPLPTSPGGPTPWGQQGGGQPFQQGVKPSLWDRMKSVFTGENPWEASAPQGPQGPPGQYGDPGAAHHGAPPYGGGMPGSQMQYDPVSQQMREMDRMNRTMNTMNMVSMGISTISMLAFMPTMFYPFGGMYF